MQNDLISRSALKKDLLDRSFFPSIVKAALEKAPAVDAVEVVRCKDCYKRYDENLCPMCMQSEGELSEYTFDDGYCDRGERRDDDA